MMLVIKMREDIGDQISDASCSSSATVPSSSSAPLAEFDIDFSLINQVLQDDFSLADMADEILRDINRLDYNDQFSIQNFDTTAFPSLSSPSSVDTCSPCTTTSSSSESTSGDAVIATGESVDDWSGYQLASFKSAAGDNDDSNSEKICLVCGNVAGKHTYYGGQVCNSCRAFFRRSVQNGTHPNFACPKDRDCEINSKSWKSCQWCRFQKCLRSGMNPYWVLNDTERKERAERRSRKLVKRTSKAPPPLLTISAMYRTPVDTFTLEDEVHVRGLFYELLRFAQTEELKFLSVHKDILEEVISSFFYGTKLSFKTQCIAESFMSKTVNKYVFSMSFMKDIPEQDRNRLLVANNPTVHAFFQAIFVDSLPMVEKFFRLLMTRMQAVARESEQVMAVADKFREVSLNGHLKVREIRYEQFFHDWERDKESEQRHKGLIRDVKEWVDGEGMRDEVDEIQMMLMSLVILFSTDFIRLENSGIVEKVQTKYAVLLSRYLKSKYSRPGSKFCRAMSISSISRELKEMRRQQLSGARLTEVSPLEGPRVQLIA